MISLGRRRASRWKTHTKTGISDGDLSVRNADQAAARNNEHAPHEMHIFWRHRAQWRKTDVKKCESLMRSVVYISWPTLEAPKSVHSLIGMLSLGRRRANRRKTHIKTGISDGDMSVRNADQAAARNNEHSLHEMHTFGRQRAQWRKTYVKIVNP